MTKVSKLVSARRYSRTTTKYPTGVATGPLISERIQKLRSARYSTRIVIGKRPKQRGTGRKTHLEDPSVCLLLYRPRPPRRATTTTFRSTATANFRSPMPPLSPVGPAEPFADGQRSVAATGECCELRTPFTASASEFPTSSSIWNPSPRGRIIRRRGPSDLPGRGSWTRTHRTHWHRLNSSLMRSPAWFPMLLHLPTRSANDSP
jgi:hypothetical protein